MRFQPEKIPVPLGSVIDVDSGMFTPVGMPVLPLISSSMVAVPPPKVSGAVPLARR